MFSLKRVTEVPSITIGVGEIKVTRKPVIMQSLVLGSCIGLVLYDRYKGIAGMAHILLPNSRSYLKRAELVKYADSAIDIMLKRMLGLGAVKENIRAIVIGGAKFEDETIGEENIKSTLRKLRKEKIKIAAKETGGGERRSIIFDVKTGECFYTVGDDNIPRKLIQIANNKKV